MTGTRTTDLHTVAAARPPVGSLIAIVAADYVTELDGATAEVVDHPSATGRTIRVKVHGTSGWCGELITLDHTEYRILGAPHGTAGGAQ